MWYTCLISKNISNIHSPHLLHIHKIFNKTLPKPLKIEKEPVDIQLEDDSLSNIQQIVPLQKKHSSFRSKYHFDFSPIEKDSLVNGILGVGVDGFNDATTVLLVKRFNSIFNSYQMQLIMTFILTDYSNNIREILTNDVFASSIGIFIYSFIFFFFIS
jgi:hypothetical protein